MPIMRVAAGGVNNLPRQSDLEKRRSKMKSMILDDDAAQKKRLSNNLASERSSLTPYGTEKTLKVTVRLTEKTEKNETPGSVYFKDDEDRFTQQHTLKLKTLFEYDVKMEVEPAQEIMYVVLGNRKHEKLQVINNPDEEAKSVYNFVWSTKQMKTTDRKYRTVLPCRIKFKPYKELVFNMQVKFYTNEEIAHYTGEPLQFLDLDCKVGTGKDKSTNLYPPIRFN